MLKVNPNFMTLEKLFTVFAMFRKEHYQCKTGFLVFIY